MLNDELLQKNVQEALAWEPAVSGAQIGVSVVDGIVTLSGAVDSYAKKMEVEKAAKQVHGVLAIVEKIEIEIHGKKEQGDQHIAADVLRALDRNSSITSNLITVTVEKGWVTLEGELQRNYQKEAIYGTIYHIDGIKGIKNYLKIKTRLEETIERKDIERAMLRNWSLDSRKVQVSIEGNTVTLKGEVSSIYQKDQAASIAWNAPGVNRVDNELLVVPA